MSSSLTTSARASVIILGNDAVLAARPCTAVQLARACLSYGYVFVAPVSWGDELVAENAARSVMAGPPHASLLQHCPLVAALASAADTHLLTDCSAVAPPIATARYLRSAFAEREIHVTYAGLCPGANGADIDEHISPDALLGRLLDAGCVPLREPTHFDDVIPPDRRRFSSRPGGAPDPDYLAATVPYATLRDVAVETLLTVARHCNPDERCLLDLSIAAGCHCASNAHAVQQLEPPRAPSAVINKELFVDLSVPPRPAYAAPVLSASGGPTPAAEPPVAAVESPEPGGSAEYWAPEGTSVRTAPTDSDSSPSDAGGPSAPPQRDSPLRLYTPGPTVIGSEPAPPASAHKIPAEDVPAAPLRANVPEVVPDAKRGTDASLASGAVEAETRPANGAIEMPRLSSAVALGGSLVTLLLTPPSVPPASRSAAPAISAESRAGVPMGLVPAARAFATAASPPSVQRLIVPTLPPAAPPPRRPLRRPVRLSGSRTGTDATTLANRLPCRARSALVTTRPPDATPTAERSTSIAPRT